MLKGKYILLSADTYSITDQQTGEINDGMNIWYVASDTLERQTRDARGKNLSAGILPTQGSLPYEAASKIVSVPAIYEFTMEMKTVKQNAHGQSKMIPIIVPVDIKYMGDIKLTVTDPTPNTGK